MNRKSRIDEELIGLGRSVLASSFYEEFSALVNKYLAAAEGDPEQQGDFLYGTLGEQSNVASVDDKAGFEPLDIRLHGPGLPEAGLPMKSIFDALAPDREIPGARIDVAGRTEFEYQSTGWIFVGGYDVLKTRRERAS